MGTPPARGKGTYASGKPTEADSDDNGDSASSASDGSSLLGAFSSMFAVDPLSEEECGEAVSLFCPTSFPTARMCWDFMEREYSFSLPRIRAEWGDQWTPYHKIRLVNRLRALGPEKARAAVIASGSGSSSCGIGMDEPFWVSDDALMPVLEDDGLLIMADEDEEEDFMDGGRGLGPGALAGKEEGKGEAKASSPSSGDEKKEDYGSTGPRETVPEVIPEEAVVEKLAPDVLHELKREENLLLGEGKGYLRKEDAERGA